MSRSEKAGGYWEAEEERKKKHPLSDLGGNFPASKWIQTNGAYFCCDDRRVSCSVLRAAQPGKAEGQNQTIVQMYGELLLSLVASLAVLRKNPHRISAGKLGRQLFVFVSVSCVILVE